MFQTGIGNYGSPFGFRNMGAMPGMGVGGFQGGIESMGGPQGMARTIGQQMIPGIGGSQGNPYMQQMLQHLQQQSGNPKGMAQAMGRQMIPGMDGQARGNPMPMGHPAPMGQPGGVLGMPGMGMPQPQQQAPGQISMPPSLPSVAGMSPSNPRALAQGVGQQMIPGMGKPMGIGGGAATMPQGGGMMKPAVMPQGGAQMPGMVRAMGRM